MVGPSEEGSFHCSGHRGQGKGRVEPGLTTEKALADKICQEHGREPHQWGEDRARKAYRAHVR